MIAKIPVGASFKRPDSKFSFKLRELGGDRMWVRNDNAIGFADGQLLEQFGQEIVEKLIRKYKSRG